MTNLQASTQPTWAQVNDLSIRLSATPEYRRMFLLTSIFKVIECALGNDRVGEFADHISILAAFGADQADMLPEDAAKLIISKTEV